LITIRPGPESFQVIVILGLLALAIIAAAVLIQKKSQKKKQLLRSRHKITDFPHQYQKYQPEINLIRRMLPALQSHHIQKTADPERKEIDILEGRRDITQSLQALVEKYSLGTFTIATSDGLVFASSGGDDAHTNAATYSVMPPQDPHLKASTVIVPGLTHKGSPLIGIIRTQNPVSEKNVKRITQETQVILDWWL
jgi:hypothetical protein